MNSEDKASWRSAHAFAAETVAVLEIAETFLQQYFGHSATEAERLLTAYFQRPASPSESYIVHSMSWSIAKRVHFVMALQGAPGDIIFWEVENDLRKTPRDALAYMREHFWSKDFPSVRLLDSRRHYDGQ